MKTCIYAGLTVGVEKNFSFFLTMSSLTAFPCFLFNSGFCNDEGVPVLQVTGVPKILPLTVFEDEDGVAQTDAFMSLSSLHSSSSVDKQESDDSL